jgi:tRNA A37 threonylcarbamoyladenosine synthetase subunit TsaC/SUA5/YrdC
MVLPAAQDVPAPLLGPSGGVGLRCSSDATATALVTGFGEPITATSANPSGRPPAHDVATAHAYFGESVACYLDGGRREATSASTVVEFLNDRVILRRAGVITKQRVGAIVALHSSE